MIDINIDPVLLIPIINFPISWHGLFSFIGVIIAVFFVARWAPYRGVSSDTIYSIAIWAILGGFIGARIVHVVDNWDIYGQDLIRVFYFWSGGIGLWGGILGGFIGGATYSYLKKYPIGIIADITAPMMLISQTIGRIGDIINGEHCSTATNWILGFKWIHPDSAANYCLNGKAGDSSYAHPAILYEMIWNMLALVLLWKLKPYIKPDGMLFCIYLALYAIGRFIISFFREDPVWALGLQEAQFISILVLAITIPILIVKARLNRTSISEDIGVIDDRTRAERRRN
ncbi:MAG: prolipoprotein diacylglyceryl transferase [SAR202 cluster bacterium]|nr:prolipoprotein diacylglyceryl transferase [SAR202 cluster bacterium]